MREQSFLILGVVLMAASQTCAQTTAAPIEYRFHAIDCRNGHPIKGRKVAMSLSVPAKPKYDYERIQGRTDKKGLIVVRFKNQASGGIRADLADSDWGFDVEGLTPEIRTNGVSKNYCTNRKHVDVITVPGELRLYFEPIHPWDRFLALFGYPP